MGASDMKKFIINILIFFGIVAVVDMAAGKLFWFLQSTKAGGRTGAEYYACKESNEDVIIMGSSRASHHYVPQTISDSLGLSCFNAGQDGNGIIMQYGRWKMISERYSPKIIIYDVNPSFDLAHNDNMTYIDRLKPFCQNNQVESYVSMLFPLEHFKLYSRMYRYNYKFIEFIFDCSRVKNNGLQGYIPLEGYIREEIVRDSLLFKKGEISFDNIKIKYLDELANECKEHDVELLFVASPCFKGGKYNSMAFAPIQAIADKYDFTFVNYYDSEYSYIVDLFKDSNHLNDKGARAFTAIIVNNLNRQKMN